MALFPIRAVVTVIMGEVVVMVVVVVVMVELLILEITHEPAQEVTRLVDHQPEYKGINYLEDKDLLEDQVREVDWKTFNDLGLFYS